MTYRIKVIEYESGRKEYVPQVRRWWWNRWKYIWNGDEWRICDIVFIFKSPEDATEAINSYKTIKLQSIIKSVTYKPVQP